MDRLTAYVETYGDYLEDVRRRLYVVVIIFVCIFVAGFFATPYLVKLMTSFLKISSVSIVATAPFQLIDLAMDVGFFLAVVFTSPVLLFHVYQFLRPGLLYAERRVFFFLIPVGVVLFILGFTYGFAIMYCALGAVALVNQSVGIVNLWDISLFMSQMLLTSTLLGLLFEFPIIISFLIRLGVVQVDFLRAKRRHAIVIIFLFVGLLPPTDGLSLILMSAPLVAIYELTIMLNAQRVGVAATPE